VAVLQLLYRWLSNRKVPFIFTEVLPGYLPHDMNNLMFLIICRNRITHIHTNAHLMRENMCRRRVREKKKKGIDKVMKRRRSI